MRKEKGRQRGVLLLMTLITVMVIAQASLSEAKDLTNVLKQGFSFVALGSDPAAVVPSFAPTFSSAVAQAVALEFPNASVAPAFSYRFNPALNVFERTTGVPGPLFSERAFTLGKGRFNFGIGYAFVDFSEFNGTDLDNIRSPALIPDIIEEVESRRDDGLLVAPLAFSRTRTRLDINAHVIAPSFRYGITPRWDIALVVPIVHTFLRVRNDTVRIVEFDPDFARILYRKDAQGNLVEDFGFIDGQGRVKSPADVVRGPLTTSQRRPGSPIKAAGSSTGIGDVSIRTKYHLWQTDGGGAAVGLNLQLPTGELRNFQGAEETHLTTFLYVSELFWDRFEPHVNLGVDFNADDVNRSSFLYSVGGSVLVWNKLGISADILGRSEFERFKLRIPQEGFYSGRALNGDPKSCTKERPCFIDVDRGFVRFPFFPLETRRNDIINFSFGFRYPLGTAGSVFFGGLIPLNNDGIRADFIPSGGVEYTF
jgi:hypothetical protein